MEFMDLVPRLPVWFALAITGLAVFAVWRSHRVYSSHLSGGHWYLLNRLVIVGLLFLALCHPALRSERVLHDNKILSILTDTSLSMGLENPQVSNKTKRLESIRSLLEKEEFITPLREKYNLQFYRFDAKTSTCRQTDLPVTDEDLGLYTGVKSALENVSARISPDQLAGIVLLSDGGENEMVDERRQNVSGLSTVPVFSIGVGGNESLPMIDREIEEVMVPERISVNSHVEIMTLVRFQQNEPSPVPLRISLADENGGNAKIVASATLEMNESMSASKSENKNTGRTIPAAVSFIPNATGRFRLTVSVPLLNNECIEENNGKAVLIEVKDPDIPVLYLEGKPRFEYKFLKRALESDEFIQPTSVLRLGTKQFLIQTGSQVQTESEPSIFRDLNRYKVIILGEIAPEALGEDLLDALAEFVQKGGGLLTFIHPGIHQTSNQEFLNLLPFDPSEEMVPQSFAGEFNFQISRRGQSHPLFSGGLRRQDSPIVLGGYRLPSLKASASVLAHLKKDSLRTPGILIQRYGEGRIVATAVRSSWRWELLKGTEGNRTTFFQQFWRQAVRWLAGLEETETTQENPLIVKTDSYDYYPQEPVHLTAYVSRDYFKVPPKVIATEDAPDSPTLVFAREGSWPGNSYRYSTTLYPHKRGVHQLHVRVQSKTKDNEAESSQFERTVQFELNRSIRELENNALDEAFLKGIANKTQGHYLPLERAGELHSILPEPQRVQKSQFEHEIWNHWSVLILISLLLCLEWAVRRRYERLKV